MNSDKPQQKSSIKSWNLEERPREKMEAKGASALTLAELVAILLNTGTREKSALDLARELLDNHNNSLISLSQKPLQDFKKIKGIGAKKATTLLAALELGRRRKAEEIPPRATIQSSKDAYMALAPFLEDQSKELFVVLLLNQKNQIITTQTIATGGITGVVADPRVIFKTTITFQATGLIVAHNHPSGNLKPSEEDKKLTEKLKEGGKLLEIRFLDHLIITSTGYFSFADEGYI